MKVQNYIEKLELVEGVTVTVDKNTITLKGEKGEVSRRFIEPSIIISVEDNSIKFDIKKYTKSEKTLLGTYKSHLKNIMKGVIEGHEYRLKICSGHFPMNVSFNNNIFQVKNFLGEKIPRKLEISKEVQLVVEGDSVTINGINKELVAQTAASIEQLTRRSNFDKRVFQDGIYIVIKDGKEIK